MKTVTTILFAILACVSCGGVAETGGSGGEGGGDSGECAPAPVTCRPDCDTATCPGAGSGDGNGRCIVCDDSVTLVDLGCAPLDDSCGGQRWVCGP